MTFAQYWAILMKRWQLVVLCLLIMGPGMFLISIYMTPIYQAQSLIQVVIHSGNNQSDINELLASNQLVQTEAQLAVSGPVIRAVVSHYSGLTADTLAKEASAGPKLNTQLFVVTVHDSDPKRAAALANDIATTLVTQQELAREQENTASQKQLQQEIALTQQQLASTKDHLSQLQEQNAPKSQTDPVVSQMNDLQQHENQWQSALAELELSEAQGNNFLQIDQLAQPATSPVQPNVWINTGAGICVGLLSGLLLVLLIDQMDKRVRTPDVVGELVDWPLLSTVWQTHEGESVINPSGESANIEAYRMLRSSIGFAGVDKPLRYVMVTSAAPQEGKSTIAANLAIFMAKAGKSTLLIDADLRRPSMHEKFGISADKPGLSNAILTCGMSSSSFISTPLLGSHMSFSGRAKILESFIHTVAGVPNLGVMPSGPLPPNPSELLDSLATQRLFQALEHCGAEIIIFDTSPLLGLADSSVLAAKMDGAIVVVDTGKTTKVQIRQMQATLMQTGSRVLGYVVNRQRRSRKFTSYSYYYYYRHSNQQVSEVAQSYNCAGMSCEQVHEKPATCEIVLPSTAQVKQYQQ
ncbi:MAG TPA: polysaccharide biosynthesis tyrosine autokinase [Dictyobacter sp.]|jgi:non-specific protein-tyrosine kinase|nr:polysaccharide biosynthesis tyrosine autokinase [Dictyobacter sp.]